LFAQQSNTPTKWHLFVAPTLVRILLFASAFYYLLHTTRVHFIVSLLCFVIAFWMTILRIKVNQHDKP